MNTLSRVLLTILALLGVSALGYYAYILSSQTLTLPFLAGERQMGDRLELVFSPPSLSLGVSSDEIIDREALLASLVHGEGESAQGVLSGEYSLDTNGGYVRITDTRTVQKDAAPLILSARIYNEKKSTPYRLPRDFTLTPSDVPKNLSITSLGDPRDQLYQIELYGIPDITPSDIRYYVHSEASGYCEISSWGHPELPLGGYYQPKKSPFDPVVSGESSGGVSRPSLSPWIYRPLIPEVIVPPSKDGQKWISQVRLPYDLSLSRLCIVAGVSGVYRTLEDRTLEGFSLTGGLIQALSPEHDMKSQVEFRFSHDIYSDTGALYSPEYIANRQDAKIAFLKALDISPALTLTESDLILTPERAILTLPLRDSEKYTFSLRDISDIYGRKASLSYSVTPTSSPFLSLRLTEGKQIYTPSDVISAKLYSLLPEKTTYPLKLCRVTLETYARLERMLVDTHGTDNTILPSLLASSQVTDCRTKDIVLTSGGYISPFTIDEFFSGGVKKTGMYVLSFAEKADTEKFQKFIAPIIFSIIDTHIIMKVDASGKMMFLATDIATGKPLPDQEITLLRNISRTHTEKWDPVTGNTEKIYLPLTTQAFATGIVIGRTDAAGYLDKKVDTLPGIEGYDSNPYGLSFESWWDYEGRYDSFLVQSRSGDRLGYVVSTWNDGITGYNFGIKDSDYSYATRSQYTSYLHTDRRLYLPGEKVYIHAIIRENNASLSIPTDTPFDIVVTDPMGREVKRATLKSNEFGSLSTELSLTKDASLGSYTIGISPTSTSEYIENGWSNFQVEVFKNPTFTASVELTSPDLSEGAIKDLRKESNTDPYSPWYDDVYTGNFTIEGIVKARYYNGADIKNTSFTYRVYRSEYYADDYWGDCFWGCYYEPPLEQYSEGSGMIDGDGYGIIRIPVSYKSYYSDYKYSVEVTIRDTLTGEEVTTPGSLIVKLPEIYKSFSLDNPLTFTPKKKILLPGESLAGEVAPTYGKWDVSLAGKYRYDIVSREYREVLVDDIRAGTLRITTPLDRVVASGSIVKKDFSDTLIGMKPGEYHMLIMPIIASGEPPESSISDTIFYISGDMTSLRDSTLRVIPERTIYKAGETARVLIQVPFAGSQLLITREKGGIIDREYVTLTGNTLMREYPIDDTMTPNVYIGVVALSSKNRDAKSRSYAVGYGEIVTDIADKKSVLTIVTDKTTYKNRENVNVDLTLTDRSGNPLQGEITLMAVDESLIRLLGNIDLDIIPKFYQKYPFTMKTALSAIGIERQRFLSRKGSNGGGGDKGGGGVQISSRTLFQNTAFYSPSIRTDVSGKAKIAFPLPDNITDYRIIAIAGTRDARFGVAEKTIEVRKDYVVEVSAPTILRGGDTSTLTATVSNNTRRITPVEVTLRVGTGSSKSEKKLPLSLGVMERGGVDFPLTIPSGATDTLSYSVEVREQGKLLDSIVGSLTLPKLPIVLSRSRSFEIFTGTTFTHTIAPSLLKDMDKGLSSVEVSLSSGYAPQIAQGIASLLQYPYGCIEQTIASTFPNRLALSLSDILGIPIDATKAREYTKKGLEKILRMQHYSGGWVYWEGSIEADVHITPYVLRMLLQFRSLGEPVGQEVFQNGINYIINNESLYFADADSSAEATWTLALLRDERALLWWNRIDVSKLTRHGYLAYAYAAEKLGKYTPLIEEKLTTSLDTTDESWYWTRSADKALFTQLLLERGESEKALKILDPLVRSIDLTSYYTSTQEKMQILLALIAQAKTEPKLTGSLAVALRSEGLIGDLSLSSSKTLATLSTSREKIGASYTLKRDSAKLPLYVTTTLGDRTKDITQMQPYSTGGIAIERIFEQVDESKGVDTSGEFIVTSPVRDMTFQKGKLYRVTLRMSFPARSWHHLAVEDFFPAGWRPIQGLFQTETSLVRQAGGSSWWDYIESREDRLLATQYMGYDESRTYVYYIRPEHLGEYLLPPATAYFMYLPEIHAYTKYDRVKVIQ